MKRSMILSIFVMATLLLGVMGLSGLVGADTSDSGDDLEFTWLVSPGRSLEPGCDQDAADAFDNCPALATASESTEITNDQSIEIKGEGTLRIDAEDGEPKGVDGGGRFIHTIDGNTFTGTWEAKQLLMFETYGPGNAAFIAVDPEVRAAWRTGRALILVHLEDDAGTMETDAILEIGCRLPGNLGISGTIEGIRLLLGSGLNFNEAADPRATLFIDITDNDDDSNDEGS